MQDNAQSEPPRWQPLSAIDRRVAGVLVEKAKTTPDAYPLSLNAIVTAANQKNNRYPLMELEAEAAQESVDRLRGLGAIALVQGSSRVDRFRHLLYEWLRVDKVELAVAAEARHVRPGIVHGIQRDQQDDSYRGRLNHERNQ